MDSIYHVKIMKYQNDHLVDAVKKEFFSKVAIPNSSNPNLDAFVCCMFQMSFCRFYVLVCISCLLVACVVCI